MDGGFCIGWDGDNESDKSEFEGFATHVNLSLCRGRRPRRPGKSAPQFRLFYAPVGTALAAVHHAKGHPRGAPLRGYCDDLTLAIKSLRHGPSRAPAPTILKNNLQFIAPFPNSKQPTDSMESVGFFYLTIVPSTSSKADRTSSTMPCSFASSTQRSWSTCAPFRAIASIRS